MSTRAGHNNAAADSKTSVRFGCDDPTCRVVRSEYCGYVCARYGRKLAVEVFMDKVLQLCDNNIPIIMICPMGFRLNQRITSKRWRNMRDNYPKICSIISLPLDIFEDTLFHCEILCFNCDKLEPHYFLDNI